MQNTRLNTLVDRSIQRLTSWLNNPWRRLSVLIISLLLGNFLASVVSTVAGQKADLDILASALLVGLVELVSWLVYRYRNLLNGPRPLWLDLCNGLKLGLIYGLFVEAFKLGS